MIRKLRYGVAYYDEYMPYDRLDKDIELMMSAGINTVRIAESTWSTLEPQNGSFDFRSVDRVLDAMHAANIDVIIGTPTYAVPAWLVHENPDVLAETAQGRNLYGPRQNMDITHPGYLFHAERVIRKLLERVSCHPVVIGYQADNETKHYSTSGPRVQKRFVQWLKSRYASLDELNARFGLDYWSNRINSWEEFPSMTGSINASLKSEFARFQRELVTEFLAWQVRLINEYKQEGQFVTQNFDFEWRGYSFGIQPDVDHFAAAKAFDIAGVDIYHPSQNQLTGAEISFGGDMARSMKQTNYLVLETQAQAFPTWTPYPGQLRQLAFSHIASGAIMVAYWHFHSIHNSFETYWKGLLSHDFAPNPTFLEAITIGQDFARLNDHLLNLKIENQVAVLFSNEALTALEAFFPVMGIRYNDELRAWYDALYRQNTGCDFIDPQSDHLEHYKMIVVPSLYAAPDGLLKRLERFIAAGGHVVFGVRSGFAQQDAKVRTQIQPGIISQVCGVTYTEFVMADQVRLDLDRSMTVPAEHLTIEGWMELLEPQGATVLGRYQHPYWGQYAGITFNHFGQGSATYVGCRPSDKVREFILAYVLKEAGLWGQEQRLHFPLITKSGVNLHNHHIRFYFNYSSQKVMLERLSPQGIDLITGESIAGVTSELPDWGFLIVDEGEIKS